MKALSNFVGKCFIVSFFMMFVEASLAQDIEIVSYAESFSVNGTDSHVDLLPKLKRLNKQSQSIEVRNDEMPDSILKCIYFAKDIWEATVSCSDCTAIGIYYLPKDNDIVTDVYYIRSGSVGIPYALYKYLTQANDTALDGSIYINSDVNWDCSIGDNMAFDRPNLTSALLRSFAKIFGFGSSLRVNDTADLYWSAKRFYTSFDKLIVSSDNEVICDYALNGWRPNKNLTDFVNSDSRHFYIDKNGPLYELEKSPSQDCSILSFFKDGNSLMSSIPRIGSYYLTVDTLTTSVLKSIGWNINDPSKIEIVCDDASDNGIMSAYTQHSFHIKSAVQNSISSPQWKLSLPLADGDDEVVFLNDGGLSCTVPAIKDEKKYKVNINGDIYGILDFSCTLNGSEVHAASYRLSLELKPRIEYVKIYKIVQHPELQTYDAFFEVNYLGADYITIDIEEEYGSWLRTKTLYEPYWANGICEQIAAPFQAWIDFSVRNNYGVDTYTVELDPYGEIISANIFSPGYSQIADIRDHGQIKYIEVYNINSAFIGTFNSISDLNANLRKGVYILKEVHSSGVIKTKKYVK